MPLILLLVIAAFPVSEVVLAFVKRSRGRGVERQDRGSMRLLWLTIALGLGLAIASEWVRPARIALPLPVLRSVSLVVLVAGLAIRWVAILTLGKLFTVDVAIHDDHVVVQHGLYRLVRHPSYTGLLVAFLGVGVAFANWLSLVGLLLPIVLGVLNRVAREEQALLSSLGQEYAAYCARTKRFIPGVY